MILDKYYKQESSNSIAKFILKDPKIKSKKGLFLDRDGVLIEDVHHIRTPRQVTLCEGTEKFLKEAKKKRLRINSRYQSIISF